MIEDFFDSIRYMRVHSKLQKLYKEVRSCERYMEMQSRLFHTFETAAMAPGLETIEEKSMRLYKTPVADYVGKCDLEYAQARWHIHEVCEAIYEMRRYRSVSKSQYRDIWTQWEQAEADAMRANDHIYQIIDLFDD